MSALAPSFEKCTHGRRFLLARPPFYLAFSGVVCSIPCHLPYGLRHHVIFGPAQVGHVAQAKAVAKVAFHPRIAWAGAAPGKEELQRLHHEAHQICFIANSVKTRVTIG